MKLIALLGFTVAVLHYGWDPVWIAFAVILAILF